MAQILSLMFRCAAIGATLLSAAIVAFLRSETGLGRLRDVGLWWMLRRLGLFFNRDLTRPYELLNRQYDLFDWSEAGLFLLAAAAANIALAAALGAAVAPFVLLAAKAFPPELGRGREWFWRVAFPLGILCGFVLLSALQLASYDSSSVAEEVLMILPALLLLVGGFYVGLLGCLRRGRQVARLLRFAAAGAFACVALGAVTAAVGGLSASRTGRTAEFVGDLTGAPNVLLVSFDSLRADRLHCYGNPRETSPTIDSLAREGVRFETVVAGSSWTLPSHATLLSSLDPKDHGVIQSSLRLSDEVTLVSEVFQREGYETAAFVSGPLVNAVYGFLQGFSLYDDYTAMPSRQSIAMIEPTSPALSAVLAKWLRNHAAQPERRPFFVFLHMWDVHYEYVPPEPFRGMFDPDYRETFDWTYTYKSSSTNKYMEARDLRHWQALYDGEIRFTDHHLGRVIDVLRELGVLDQTIIAVTADHGDEFFEHGDKGHGKTLYEEVLRVPLVIRYPSKIAAGRLIGRQVRSKDIAPTLLDLAGIPRPDDFGTAALGHDYPESSLLALIHGGEDAAAFPDFAFSHLKSTSGGELQAALRTSRYKLILWEARNDELYDLFSDPGEKDNLLLPEPSEADARVYEALRRLYVEWESANLGNDKRPTPLGLGDEHLDVLRGLGYIQ